MFSLLCSGFVSYTIDGRGRSKKKKIEQSLNNLEMGGSHILTDKEAVCESGIIGWKCKIQENYSSFREFKEYCKMYAIHTRLGYKSMKKAWEENPLIKGSTIPSDLEIVKN